MYVQLLNIELERYALKSGLRKAMHSPRKNIYPWYCDETQSQSGLLLAPPLPNVFIPSFTLLFILLH